VTPTNPPTRPSSGAARGALTVAYVVSMTAGLHSFVFREIRELYALGVSVRLFPTQVGSGPYMPPATWPLDRLTPMGFVRAHLRMLRRRFRRYLASLREALRFGALPDFALGAFFAAQVDRFGVELVHCHFGDHKLFIGYFAGTLSGRPFTVTIHAYELYNNPNPRMFRRALAAASATVTTAEYKRSVLAESWGVDRAPVEVIALFANLLTAAANPIRSAGDTTMLLTVARFLLK